MVRLCGAALGFLAFAITVLLGLSVDNPPEVTLERGLRAMVGFFALGLLVGWVAFRVMDEHALRRKREMFGETGAEEATEEAADPSAAGKQSATAKAGA